MSGDLHTSGAHAAAPYFEGLNGPQREAVEAVDGPLLVLAGAGTGKTRVLTTRIAHILKMRRAWPDQILAVTFTNRAAREMSDRVAAMIGSSVDGLWIGTFHSTAARILRRHAGLVGLGADFTILDQDDQIRLVKRICGEEKIDEKRWPARAVHAEIERFKDRGLAPEENGPNGTFADGRIGSLYRSYQERLMALNAVDFGDLLLHCVTLFREYSEVLASWGDRFHYILVDEYQDSNVAQYLWLRLLAQGRNNICCVGDDDQSIYSWRGAEVGNILRFEQEFPGARIVRLEQNYRSTQPLLTAASKVISRNRKRLGKTLWTEARDGQPVAVRSFQSGEAEAAFVGKRILELQRRGEPLGEIAILVRAAFLMREFEDRLLDMAVPYRVVGGPRFYERREIRDAVAYLRAVAQPADDLALERIVNVPRRGIGEVTLATWRAFARDRSVPLQKAARQLIEVDGMSARVRAALGGLVAQFDRWRKMNVPPHELAEIVLEESGYAEMWRADPGIDAPGRIENLEELVSAIAEFDSLSEFLEYVSLVMDREDSGRDMVSLMTLHAAKGLEFAHVFLPAWEENVFPNRRSLEERKESALEEERRLAYVGITRAKRRVWVSHAASRRIHNSWVSAPVSRFVDELDSPDVERVREDGRAEAGMAEWDHVRPGRGPGYRRMLAKRRGRLSKEQPLTVGMRVFHSKFGYGTVRYREGGVLGVAFEKAGDKEVEADALKPA